MTVRVKVDSSKASVTLQRAAVIASACAWLNALAQQFMPAELWVLYPTMVLALVSVCTIATVSVNFAFFYNNSLQNWLLAAVIVGACIIANILCQDIMASVIYLGPELEFEQLEMFAYYVLSIPVALIVAAILGALNSHSRATFAQSQLDSIERGSLQGDCEVLIGRGMKATVQDSLIVGIVN